MEAKAIESIDLIAPVCRTINSDHVRIYPVPNGSIPIVYDDRDGRRRGRSRREQRRMLRCQARRITPPLPPAMKPLALRILAQWVSLSALKNQPWEGSFQRVQCAYELKQLRSNENKQ